MPVITYYAKREIIGGHALGVQYQIENALQIIDDDETPRGTEREALDSVSIEYSLDSIRYLTAIGSDEISQAELPLWREFVKSVLGRELFQIDFTGTIAAPGTDVDVKWYAGGFKPIRTAPGMQSYKLSFTVRHV